MKTLRIALIVGALMALSSVGGIAARPTVKANDGTQKFLLEDIVPKQFGDWKELPGQGVQVVNPQTQEILDKLYSQILSRTYVNSQGYKIMLSLAYGDDQRGGLAAHKPEVCYPAQGFRLLTNQEAQLPTPFGAIPGRRLDTSMGQRREPVTYWFNVGDTAVRSKLEKRMVQIRLGLTGQIPDGLLFRVSSIDDQSSRAYVAHDAFVGDLLSAVSPKDRIRLSGLGKPG